MVAPLKELSNFWRTLEMPLINFEVNLILTQSANCVIIYTNVENENPRFAITETKLYVTLSTRENTKLLQQLKLGFKITINRNKYLSEPKSLPQDPNLNHLDDAIFQGVNTLSVLAFKDDAQRTSRKRYYFTNVEIKDYNVMIDEKNFFDQTVKNNKITFEKLKNLLLVKEMIIQLIVRQIILILNKIIEWLQQI